MSTSSKTSSGTLSDFEDPRFQLTVDSVNWDALAFLGRNLFKAPCSHWGDQVSGAYNLVRYLHLHGPDPTTIVARVPLQCEHTSTREHRIATSNRIASEVATMQYVEINTSIPVPHILLHSPSADTDTEEFKDVKSPFILMTYVEGVRLVSVWDDMVDEKRKSILQQVVDILLELWTTRFDKPGALFRRKADNGGADTWYTDDPSILCVSGPAASRDRISTMSYTHAADYWLAYANAYLRDIKINKFGLYGKDMEYCQFWFMRSIIPSLFDPSLDNYGYPLLPGDFHSQNLMVIDVDTPNPRISGVIDWEFSSAVFVTDFVFYPLYIQDHPDWDADNPLRERNIKDRATFDSLITEAERKRTSPGGPPLSQLFLNSRPTYLFCQLMKDPYTREAFYPLLFAYVYGDDEDFEGMYYNAVMENGILRKETAGLKLERKACLEARKVLGEDVIGVNLNEAGFADIISAHLDKFNGEESPVRDWLEYYRVSKRDDEYLV